MEPSYRSGQGVSSPGKLAFRLDAAVLCAVPSTSYLWSIDRTNGLARDGLGDGYSSRINDGDRGLDCSFSGQ